MSIDTDKEKQLFETVWKNVITIKPHPDFDYSFDYGFEYWQGWLSRAKLVPDEIQKAFTKVVPPTKIAENAWKLRMVFYDSSGEPLGYRQPTKLELVKALWALLWH